MKTYRKKWQQMIERDLADFREILTWDPFETWKSLTRPHGPVKQHFQNGLSLLFGQHKQPEADAYLRLCIKISERIFAENMCKNKRCRSEFPLNQGLVKKCYCFAEALLGNSLDLSGLREASSDIEEWCRKLGKEDWEDIYQGHYLSAVRLAMIADDWQRAEELLDVRRSFKWHKKEHGLWKGIVPLVEVGPLPLADKKLRTEFDVCFDKIRNPYRAEEIAALEMGILRDKLFVSTDGTIDWERIIDMVSK